MDDEGILADPSGDPLGSEGGDSNVSETEEDRLKKDNARLSGRVTELQEMNRQVLPWVKTARKLNETPEGKEILRRLNAGEPLTASQKTKVGEESATEGGSLSRKEVEELLQKQKSEIVQATAEATTVRERAREDRQKLDTWATKEFHGYEEIRKSPVWSRRFELVANQVLQDLDDGLVEVPAEYQGDAWKWITAETYGWVKAQNPELGEKVKQTKSDEEREIEKRVAGSQRSGTSPVSDDDEFTGVSDEDQEKIQRMRRIVGSATVGKSFSG